MKIDKKDFLKELELLQSVSGPCVGEKDLSDKVIIRNDKLVNLLNGSFCTVIEGKFDFTGIFDLQTFLNTVKSMDSNEIDLDYDADKRELILSASRTKIGLKEFTGELPEDLNKMLEFLEKNKPTKIKTLPDDFIKGLNLCVNCTAKKDYTPLVNVLITPEKMIASDADRIGFFNTKVKIDTDIQIPREQAQKIVKIAPIKIGTFKEKVYYFFRKEDVYCITNTSEMKFPDFNKILKKKMTTEISFPSDLKEGVNLVIGLFSTLKNTDNVMKVSLKKNRIILRSQSVTGWMEKEIRTKYSGKEIEFTINAQMLKQALDSTNTMFISEDGVARMEFDNFIYIVPIEI